MDRLSRDTPHVSYRVVFGKSISVRIIGTEFYCNKNFLGRLVPVHQILYVKILIRLFFRNGHSSFRSRLISTYNTDII